MESRTIPVLFLYTRTPDYFLSCVRELVNQFHTQAHIIRKDHDPLAPFQFESDKVISLYSRESFSDTDLKQLAIKINPDIVFISGWKDQGYLKIAQYFKRMGIPVICGMDNQWRNTVKQKIATWINPWYLHRYFTHIWVAGLYQYEFARRLGFNPGNILMGLYSANTQLFTIPDLTQIPHRFIFVGRLVKAKGIRFLADAFERLTSQIPHQWQLKVIGKGPEREAIESIQHVEVIDFLQPNELKNYAKQGGVFVLPSIYEPWGVVVHEFASMGYPLIVSDAVGAGTAFVKEGYNGHIFRKGDPEDLIHVFKKIIQSSGEQLLTMGNRSKQLAQTHNPVIWSHTLFSLIDQ